MEPLIILTGPTGVGKTALSVELARDIGGSIISADSMQIYRGMDIGTAKVTPEEMGGIPHYLIDIMDPSENYSVSTFKEQALIALADIREKGRIPIICGGTGFYIQALLYDVDLSDESENGLVRERLEKEASKLGPDVMYERLRSVDPASCETIHKNNIKRVIRALEFYEITGSPISDHNAKERQKESAYNSAYFVLTMDRARLYERIDKRVDIMMEEGLLEEARRVYDLGLSRELTAMQAIGYRELFSCFDGEISLDRAVELIKQNSRHYAKRQLTWFKREKEVIWLEKDGISEADLLNRIKKTIKDKGIIK